MEEVVPMSQKELDRHFIFKKLIKNELTQVQAAEILGVTDRQVRRLLNQFKDEGV